MKTLKTLLILLFITNLSFGQSQKRIGRCDVIGEYNNFFVSDGEPNFWCIGRFAFSKLECKNNSNSTYCLESLEKTRFIYYKNVTQTATYQLNNKVLEALETYSIVLKSEKNEKKFSLVSIVGLFKNPLKSNEFFYEISDKPEHDSSNQSFKISYFNDDEDVSTVYSQKGVIEKIHYKYDDLNIYEKREFFNPIKSKDIPYKVQEFSNEGVLVSEIENNKITYYPDPKHIDEDYVDGFHQGNFKPYSRNITGDYNSLNREITGSYKVYSLDDKLRFERIELNDIEYIETTYYKNGEVYEVQKRTDIGNGETKLTIHEGNYINDESIKESVKNEVVKEEIPKESTLKNDNSYSGEYINKMSSISILIVELGNKLYIKESNQKIKLTKTRNKDSYKFKDNYKVSLEGNLIILSFNPNKNQFVFIPENGVRLLFDKR